MRGDEQYVIDFGRRKALKTGGGVLALFAMLGLMPELALAGTQRAAFEAKTLDEAFNALGSLVPEDSRLINLNAPDVAENGAIVPITIETSLQQVEQISILADKNPTMLVANFIIPQDTEAFLTTRIKMAQTSRVVVLVKAGGKFYRAVKEVKVTQGGC